MVVLEIVAQHFENNFAQGEEILVGLEVLVLFGEPVVQHFDVDAPDDVIEEAGDAGHDALKYAHYLHIQGLLRLNLLDNRCDLVDEVQKLEYFASVLH